MTVLLLLALAVAAFVAGAFVQRSRDRRLMGSLRSEIAEHMRVTVELSQICKEETNKRAQTVECIMVIQGERDRWKELYMSAALTHSAAQDMLLRERERLVQQLRKAGLNPRENRAVAAVTQQFREKYVDPIGPEDRERIIGSRGGPRPAKGAQDG